MKRNDLITAVFLLVLAICVGFKSLGYRLMEEAAHVPGPGFAPFISAITMAILSILLLIESVAGKESKKEKNVPSNLKNSKEVLLLFIGLLGYALFLNALGFILSMSILMALLFRGQAKGELIKRWLMPICIGLSISLISYFIFYYLIGCELPKGFLGI
jgi:phosphotransferase system  glucose/maltose/N-acetylglucosamine-specific IIC component